MENNGCEINHWDADVLLPPRKRLLAGMKRQHSDVNLPTPSKSSVDGSDFDARMNNLIKNQMSNPSDFDARMNNLIKNHTSNSKLSNEEIVEASRLAAVEASKAARAARVAAEEKAAKAAKAVAAAKSALELVATVEENANREKYSKKSKMKKHVAVHSLYNKQKGSPNCRADEELARKLHQVINSSPRILKNTSTSESKNPKHKKLKISSPKDTSVQSGGVTFEGTQTATSNEIVSCVDSDDRAREKYAARVDFNIPKLKKSDGLKIENNNTPKFNYPTQLNTDSREADKVLLEKQVGEDDDSGVVKKKWKIKQKKLPLSICNVRDPESPKEDSMAKSLSSAEGNRSKPTTNNKASFPVGPSGDSVTQGERAPTWKCQAFRAPACVKQNKVMQS